MNGIEPISIIVYRDIPSIRSVYISSIFHSPQLIDLPNVTNVIKQIISYLSSCEGSCPTEYFNCDGFSGDCWIVGSCCGTTELLIADYNETTSNTCTCLESSRFRSIRPCLSNDCSEIQTSTIGNGSNTCDAAVPVISSVKVIYYRGAKTFDCVFLIT